MPLTRKSYWAALLLLKGSQFMTGRPNSLCTITLTRKSIIGSRVILATRTCRQRANTCWNPGITGDPIYCMDPRDRGG